MIDSVVYIAICTFILGIILYLVNFNLKKWIYNFFELSTAILIVLTLFIIGLFRGLNVSELAIDMYWVSFEVMWLNAISTSIIFTIGVLFTGFLLYIEISTPKDHKTRTEGPSITAIIPVYKDHNVLHRSVESLADSTYTNLEIAIAYESNDSKTVEKSKQLQNKIPNVTLAENKYPGSKAGAIQTVVEESSSDYFAVFDADEIIKSDFISTAMYSMTEGGYDIFQGRRIPDPTGLVETLAYCERISYHASYKLVELTGFRNCRSSSTGFTRQAFDIVGGYDDMLTEDLAFAHKAYRHNLSVQQSRNYTSIMEAPHTFRDFWGQRKRWRMGQVETLHRSLSGTLTDGIWYRRYISIGRMTASMIGSIIIVVVISKLLILVLLGTTLFYLSPLLAVLIVALICGYVDKKNGDIDSIKYIGLLAPIVYPIFSILLVKSILEYLITWDGSWYHVEKQES